MLFWSDSQWNDHVVGSKHRTNLGLRQNASTCRNDLQQQISVQQCRQQQQSTIVPVPKDPPVKAFPLPSTAVEEISSTAVSSAAAAAPQQHSRQRLLKQCPAAPFHNFQPQQTTLSNSPSAAAHQQQQALYHTTSNQTTTSSSSTQLSTLSRSYQQFNHHRCRTNPPLFR
jgi:hypothetical protein